VRAEIAAVRARGYSLSTDRVVAGAGIVGVLLPASVAGQPIGLGLGGLSSTIEAQAQSLVAELNLAIARHLG
jgi:DNA-binding IclR family transcriptional regulator